MRAALRSRLERLEVRVEPKKPQLIRSGYLKTLSPDYVGERHVAIVKQAPAEAPGGVEWREFEERPGPAPLNAQEEEGIRIYIVVSERWNPAEWKPKEYICHGGVRRGGSIRLNSGSGIRQRKIGRKAIGRIEKARQSQ
jgi:hypothetical protein